MKMAQAKKMIYRFDQGDASMRQLLGGKGANLCEMASMGLPVPPGFVITTEMCLAYHASGKEMPERLWEDVQANINLLEGIMGRTFGSTSTPLLVSVRSGAPISMPGMMDTLLNLGLNDQVVPGLSGLMNDSRPALDAYRRFLQLFGKIVLATDEAAKEHLSRLLENILNRHKELSGITLDKELSAAQLREVVSDFKVAIKDTSGSEVPDDPWKQLSQAIQAVFESWNGRRAVAYRNYHRISHGMGTAVIVMPMVFGNLGDDSGTGVLFTRNPSTGEKGFYGEYLNNAQGEDVVAGIRTPQSISSLAQDMPQIYSQLKNIAERLERHYQDVQDIEFTIEGGHLYMLQTRSAARTVQARVRAAVDMVDEGLITSSDAILRIDPDELTRLFVPQFHEDARKKASSDGALLAKGFGASHGAAHGKVYFDPDRAASASTNGISVILVRAETSPEDIHGILAAAGVLTSRGGVTSHAAVVTRGLGKPCIVGCEEIHVDLEARQFEVNGRTVLEGESISIDGATGEVFYGEISTFHLDLGGQNETQRLLSWADSARRLGVLANADTPDDAAHARFMGADGIGLCRTEHMFLGDRVPMVRMALLNAPEAERWIQQHSDIDISKAPESVTKYRQSLSHLHQLQTEDFTGILRAMPGLPVIIRLLDAPLHEFMPSTEELMRDIQEARSKNVSQSDRDSLERLLSQVQAIKEGNPMLGHRGCRVGITFPEIYEMQVDAIITASIRLIQEGVPVKPEIMIPLTAHVNELGHLRRRLTETADRVQKTTGTPVNYLFGTMIEVPRAALTADEIAKEADFFSFGTNDLTQTTYGFSRDDAEGKFLGYYLDHGILPSNPFVSIDVKGVGELIRTGTERGRATRPGLEVGICGEHGGDPQSVAFCHDVGLDYVSCSLFRIPAARLAAAQAALRGNQPPG
jgi:pyruvate,orthophosphate dikinase